MRTSRVGVASSTVETSKCLEEQLESQVKDLTQELGLSQQRHEDIERDLKQLRVCNGSREA